MARNEGVRGEIGPVRGSMSRRRSRIGRSHTGVWLAFLLGAAFVGLQYRLWFGDGSIPEVLKLRAAVEVQRQENERLDDRNRELEAEVVDLKNENSLELVEYRARRDLGMIGRDETFYQIIEKR